MSPYSDSYTRLAQAAVSPPESSYPVAPPLYQTASFATDEASVFLDMATRPLHSGFYTRYGNPTTRAFESAVADLEGGECALATASGMGAITAALFAFAARATMRSRSACYTVAPQDYCRTSPRSWEST